MLVVVALSTLTAQEGHPLTGSWHGEWKPAGGPAKPVVFFLKWDNKNIVGDINPGRNAMPIKTATLDPDKWTVHFEAEAKDGTKTVVDGKLDNIGSYNRTLKGTWKQGSMEGPFEMSRD
jgi:hypothetical protein